MVYRPCEFVVVHRRPGVCGSLFGSPFRLRVQRNVCPWRVLKILRMRVAKLSLALPGDRRHPLTMLDMRLFVL